MNDERDLRIAELKGKLESAQSDCARFVAELEKAEADRKALLLLCGAESTVEGARCWMESETQLRDRIEKEFKEKLAAFDAPWDDTPLWPEDVKMDAAHPCESGDHKNYMEAMRLVGACKSKSRLVNLVNWLLKASKPDSNQHLGFAAERNIYDKVAAIVEKYRGRSLTLMLQAEAVDEVRTILQLSVSAGEIVDGRNVYITGRSGSGSQASG